MSELASLRNIYIHSYDIPDKPDNPERTLYDYNPYVCVCVCVCVCVVTRIMLHGQASVLHPSGLSQMTVWTFLQQVGQDGLLTHVRGVRDIYR